MVVPEVVTPRPPSLCVVALQGNLSARRRALVMMAYDVLDKDGSGEVTRADIEAAYDVSKNPDVISGKKTPAEAITEFMSQWETDKADGIVTRDEFLDYYKGEFPCGWLDDVGCGFLVLHVVQTALSGLCSPLSCCQMCPRVSTRMITSSS